MDEVKVEEVCPTISEPFFRHWYEGLVPPFTGFAVNVMGVPIQTDPVDKLEVTETDGVTLATAETEKFADVVCTGFAQTAFEVNRTEKFVDPVKLVGVE